MTIGYSAFNHMVTQTTNTKVIWNNHIPEDDYLQWKKDFIWEALHGQRYGQSFCNRFNIQDNHLYYNTGDIDWADEYIRKTYIARS